MTIELLFERFELLATPSKSPQKQIFATFR